MDVSPTPLVPPRALRAAAWRMLLCAAVAFPAAAALARPACAQSSRDVAQTQFARDRAKLLAEAGQRHLRIGSWARKAGLVPQATTQFLRAVEVSEGQNPGAHQVLAYMRGLGDQFWVKQREHPARALLLEYDRKTADAERRTRDAHADLAQAAGKAHLDDDAKKHWLAVLRLGGELEVDKSGAWRLDGHRIPDDLVDWLRGQTRKVDDKPVFEAAGKAAPALPNATECRNERVIVRTDLDKAKAQQLLALATALLPPLEDWLDGAPTRPLQLFVFAKAADYGAYLDARGLGENKAGRGLADYYAGQTLVNAEGLGDPELHAIVLHELAHLFFYGVAPAIMPDWYAEGFAETFGGQGTFTWDGKTLAVGGMLARHRLADVHKAPIPLADLVRGNAAQLLANDADKAHRFYAESWALQRFLREPDCPWGPRFRHFENKCRGQVLGAPEGGKVPRGSTEPAAKVWNDLFGQDLDKLELAFFAWLAQLPTAPGDAR